MPSSLGALSIIDDSRTLTSIGLQWSAPTSSIAITGYILYSDNGNGSDISQIAYNGKANPSTIKVHLYNLNSGSTYKFQYVAYNSAGVSSRSSIFTTMIGVYPDPPSSAPSLSSSSITSISFTWEASPNSVSASLTGYKIYINDVLIATVAGTVLTYTYSSSLTAGSAYLVQISTINGIGEGSRSPSAIFYAVSAPSAPILVLESADIDSCTVNWTAVSAPTYTIITGYLIQINRLDGNGYQTGCDYTNNSGNLECTLSSLNTSSKVLIRGLAYNKGGKSAYSSEISCVPVGKPGQPGTPQLVSSSASSIQVKWDGANSTGGLPITSYNLYSDEEEASTLARTENWVLVYSGTALTATKNSGLSAGKSYRFKVRAINSVNEGVDSKISVFYAGSAPPTPTSFSVSNYARTWVTLSWAKPTLVATTDPEVKGYLLYTDYGNQASYTLFANLSNGDKLSYNLTGQSGTGMTYHFKIKAYSAAGTSSLSDILSVLLCDAPSQMQSPYLVSGTKTATTTATLVIGWYSVTDDGGASIIGYKLYYTDTTTSTTSVLYDGSQNPGVLKFSATGLVLGRKYTFKISALNSREGTVSEETEMVAAGAPATISTISATSQTETCIGLSWSAPDNGGSTIQYYELYSDDGVLRYSGSLTLAYICGLNTGWTYAFSVRAVSSAMKGELSSNFTFVIAGVPTVPRYLASSSSTSTSQIVLTWEIPSSTGGISLTSYKIYRKLTTSTNYATLLATVGPAILTYTDTSVTQGVCYTYHLTAVNSIGASDNSISIEAIPIGVPGTPSAPTLVSKTRDTIRVSWAAPSNTGGSSITGYSLYISQQGTQGYSLLYSGSSIEFVAGGLSSGSTYYFKVSAKNSKGQSEKSAASDGIYAADIPLPPTNLRVTSRLSGSVTLKWDLPTDLGGVALTGYVIERALGSGDFSAVSFSGNSDPSIRELSESGLTACGVYYYRAYAKNAGGSSVASDSLKVIAATVPTAPTTAPTVSGLTKYSLTLSLTAVTSSNNGGCDITNYRIYTSVNGADFIEAATTTSTTYTFTNLQMSAVYKIKYAASNKVYDEDNAYGLSLQTSPIQTATIAVVPEVPLNFAKSSILYRDSIYLTWNAPSDLGGLPLSKYELTVTNPSDSSSYTKDISSSLCSYTVSSLIPGLTYIFKMKAINSVGSSSYTSNVTAVPGLIPQKPSNFAISSKTRSSFTLTWTAVTAEDTGGTSANPITITSYGLYVRNTQSGAAATYTTTSATYTVSYLYSGLTYGLKIRTCTSVGCSEYSSELQDLAGLAPAIPYSLSVISQSSSSISIQWQEPLDNGGCTIIGYKIGIQVDSVETIKQGIYSTSYQFTESEGLVAGKLYQFRVAAVNVVGTGDYTQKVTAYSSNTPSSVSISSSSITKTSAVISWTLHTTSSDKGFSTSDPNYVLESASCLNDVYSQVLTTTTSTSFTQSGITPGTCLRYRMKVTNNVGSSNYSSTVDVTFAVVPNAPSTPTLVSRNSSTTNGTYIKLAWTKPSVNGGSTILGYKLEQSVGSTGTWTTAYDGSTIADQLQYSAQGLTAGQTYIFRVSARNVIGYSSTSSQLSVIAASIPSAVYGLAAGSITVSGSSSSLSLSWTAGENGGSTITKYYIRYKVTAESSYTLTPSTTTASSYTISSLNAGVNYTFQVAASNAVFESNNLESFSLAYGTGIAVLIANVPSTITAFSQQTSKVSTQIILEWSAPSNNGAEILGYVLKKDDGSGKYYQIYKGTSLIYTDTGLTAGNSYIYVVLAYNSVGEGTASSTLTAKAGILPGIVQSLSVTSFSKTSIVISWSAPSDSGGFSVTKYWVMSDTGDSTYLTAEDLGTSTSYTKTVASANIGKRFHFKVAAQTSLGIGKYSDEISAIAANTPDAPSISISLHVANS